MVFFGDTVALDRSSDEDVVQQLDNAAGCMSLSGLSLDRGRRSAGDETLVAWGRRKIVQVGFCFRTNVKKRNGEGCQGG